MRHSANGPLRKKAEPPQPLALTGRTCGPIGTFQGLVVYNAPSIPCQPRSMKSFLTLIRLLTLPCCLACSQWVSAQDTLVLHITALTSAERDALVGAARSAGHVDVVYACVPAGYIAFASRTHVTSRTTLRTAVTTTISSVIDPHRLGTAEVTLRAAEQACETARGE